MSKATIRTPPLHVLRGIYRLLDTPALPKELLKKGPAPDKPTALQKLLLQRYRDGQKATGVQAQQQLNMAVTYHNMKLDLQERDRLYKLDTGADVVLSPKEMSRRAAARAGLQLPEPLDL